MSKQRSAQQGAPGKRTRTEAIELPPVAAAHPSRPAAGGGDPLAPATLAKVESAFQSDFSDVRIHHDGSADALDAYAYTQGTNIHFGAGQYDPSSAAGLRLLGHELTHVVQQRQGRVETPQASDRGGDASINSDPSLEAEADDMGGRLVRGEAIALGPTIPTPLTGRTIHGAFRYRRPDGIYVQRQGSPAPNMVRGVDPIDHREYWMDPPAGPPVAAPPPPAADHGPVDIVIDDEGIGGGGGVAVAVEPDLEHKGDGSAATSASTLTCGGIGGDRLDDDLYDGGGASSSTDFSFASSTAAPAAAGAGAGRRSARPTMSSGQRLRQRPIAWTGGTKKDPKATGMPGEVAVFGDRAADDRKETAVTRPEGNTITPLFFRCNPLFTQLVAVGGGGGGGGGDDRKAAAGTAYVCNVPTTLPVSADLTKNVDPASIATKFAAQGFSSREDAARRFCLVIGLNTRCPDNPTDVAARSAAMTRLAAEIELFTAFPVAVVSFFWTSETGKVPFGMIRSFIRDYGGVTDNAITALEASHDRVYFMTADPDVVSYMGMTPPAPQPLGPTAASSSSPPTAAASSSSPLTAATSSSSSKPPSAELGRGAPIFDRYDALIAARLSRGEPAPSIMTGGYLFPDRGGDNLEAFVGYDNMSQRHMGALVNPYFPYLPEANFLVQAAGPEGAGDHKRGDFGIYAEESQHFLRSLIGSSSTTDRREWERRRAGTTFDLSTTIVTNESKQLSGFDRVGGAGGDRLARIEELYARVHDGVVKQSLINPQQFMRRLHCMEGYSTTSVEPQIVADIVNMVMPSSVVKPVPPGGKADAAAPTGDDDGGTEEVAAAPASSSGAASADASSLSSGGGRRRAGPTLDFDSHVSMRASFLMLDAALAHISELQQAMRGPIHPDMILGLYATRGREVAEEYARALTGVAGITEDKEATHSGDLTDKRRDESRALYKKFAKIRDEIVALVTAAEPAPTAVPAAASSSLSLTSPSFTSPSVAASSSLSSLGARGLSAPSGLGMSLLPDDSKRAAPKRGRKRKADDGAGADGGTATRGGVSARGRGRGRERGGGGRGRRAESTFIWPRDAAKAANVRDWAGELEAIDEDAFTGYDGQIRVADLLNAVAPHVLEPLAAKVTAMAAAVERQARWREIAWAAFGHVLDMLLSSMRGEGVGGGGAGTGDGSAAADGKGDGGDEGDDDDGKAILIEPAGGGGIDDDGEGDEDDVSIPPAIFRVMVLAVDAAARMAEQDEVTGGSDRYRRKVEDWQATTVMATMAHTRTMAAYRDGGSLAELDEERKSHSAAFLEATPAVDFHRHLTQQLTGALHGLAGAEGGRFHRSVIAGLTILGENVATSGPETWLTQYEAFITAVAMSYQELGGTKDLATPLIRRARELLRGRGSASVGGFGGGGDRKHRDDDDDGVGGFGSPPLGVSSLGTPSFGAASLTSPSLSVPTGPIAHHVATQQPPQLPMRPHPLGPPLQLPPASTAATAAAAAGAGSGPPLKLPPASTAATGSSSSAMGDDDDPSKQGQWLIDAAGKLWRAGT